MSYYLYYIYYTFVMTNENDIGAQSMTPRIINLKLTIKDSVR